VPTATSAVGAFPTGIYTVTVTKHDLAGEGITGQTNLEQNSGTFTFSFGDSGIWTYQQTSDVPIHNPFWQGRFAVEGQTITLTVSAPAEFAGNAPVVLNWSVDRSGDIVFTPAGELDAYEKAWYTLHPFVPKT